MSANHGTRSKYVMGCRCEPCTKANRDYQRRYMASRYVPSGVGAPFCGFRRNDGVIVGVRYER